MRVSNGLVWIALLFVALDPVWAIEKIVCFPDRINVDNDIETKLRAAIAAGADGVIFDQWSKEVPFTGEPLESQLIQRQHELLDICDSAGVKAWLVSQISTKYDYGDPCAIPLRVMGDLPVTPSFYHSDTLVIDTDLRAFVKVIAEPSRLYRVSVRITGRPVQMIWMRDPEIVENQQAPVVRTEMPAGDYIVECPTLDDTDHWLILFRNQSGGSRAVVTDIVETIPQSSSMRRVSRSEARSGWYDYLGLPDQSFTWSRSPRFENDSLRRAVISRNCAYLAREFERHPSVVASFNWCDEWSNGGHDWTFQDAFPSAGAGLAGEIVRWGEIQFQYFAQPGLALGDMFYREGKYSRACNPRGGGFEQALESLPNSLPVELIAWDYDNTDPSVLLSQVTRLGGRNWAIGVNMGGRDQSHVWRQVFDRYQADPKPTKVIFFGWNQADFTEEHLSEEFAEWE